MHIQDMINELEPGESLIAHIEVNDLGMCNWDLKKHFRCGWSKRIEVIVYGVDHIGIWASIVINQTAVKEGQFLIKWDYINDIVLEAVSEASSSVIEPWYYYACCHNDDEI
ncbi:MAG: hypothetical protein ABFD08_15215 [Syntrophomonas sp.]